jgi:AcrR family transcriptional regulator
MARRTYESPLRAEQLGQTRSRIVEAAADVLAYEGYDALTVPRVAERAQVAVRTVYRHFPGREELTQAIAALVEERMGGHAYPPDAHELPSGVADVFAGFAEHERLVRASLASPHVRGLLAGERARRHATLEQVVGELAPALSAGERRARAAALYALAGLNAWDTFHHQFGLDAESAGEAAEWALRALFAALEQEGRR